MRKFLNKSVLAISLAATMVISVNSTAYATQPAPTIDVSSVISSYSDDTISPHRDEIGYRYRVTNGVLEKRLWNYTKGIWLEDAWSVA